MPNSKHQKARPQALPPATREGKRELTASSDLKTEMSVTTDESGKVRVELTEHLLLAATGIKNQKLAQSLLQEAYSLSLGATPEERASNALAFLSEMAPQNVAEAMLAVQMLGVHQAGVKFLRCATLKDQTFEGEDANVVRATRLMRLQLEQLEAMAKLKGTSGQQKVVVEHVHVHQGGQAIVGTVTSHRPGGGGGGKDAD